MRVLLQWIDFIRQGRAPCLFQLFTGYYCPGCGGTRAVMALIQGRLLLSFFYHPLVLYAAGLSALFLFGWGMMKITGNKKWCLHFQHAYLYVGIGLIAVNFLVKNIVLGIWGIDLLKALGQGW